VSVLLLGILQGVLLAALASIFLLLGARRGPTSHFSGDFPEPAAIPTVQARERGAAGRVIAFRPEASLLYINAETILETVLREFAKIPDVRLVACDLSASPYIDLAGDACCSISMMSWCSRHATLCIVGAHCAVTGSITGGRAGGQDRQRRVASDARQRAGRRKGPERTGLHAERRLDREQPQA